MRFPIMRVTIMKAVIIFPIGVMSRPLPLARVVRDAWTPQTARALLCAPSVTPPHGLRRWSKGTVATMNGTRSVPQKWLGRFFSPSCASAWVISLTRLHELTGGGLDQWCDMAALQRLQHGGWLTCTPTHLRLTHDGRAVFNEVLAQLLL